MDRTLSQPSRASLRGAALLLCMVFTAAVMTSLTVLSLRTVGHVRHAEYAALEAAALAGAEGALTVAQARMAQGASGAIGFAGEITRDELGRPHLPNFEDAGLTLQVMDVAPKIHWYTAEAKHRALPEGFRVLYACARAGSVERCIEVVLRPADGGFERVSWREVSPAMRGN